MPKLYGTLGVNYDDNVFASQEGARIIYNRTLQIFDEYNKQLEAAIAVFVDETTERWTERFKIVTGGRMQRRARNSPVAVSHQDADYTVQYPIADYADAIGGNDVELAYLTLGYFDRQVQNLLIYDAAEVRYNIFRAILNKDNEQVNDLVNGEITVRRLANQDGTMFEPASGATVTAQDNNYLGTSYLTAAISDANNPIKTIVDKIEARYGSFVGGSNIAVFINKAEQPKIEALTDYVEFTDNRIVLGANSPRLINLPDSLQREGTWKVIGFCNGAWIIVWNEAIPATYMFGIHLDQDPPLVQRVDTAASNLPRGLSLVGVDQRFPLKQWTWRHRYGFGCRNRLNGVALHLSGASTYTTPAVYV